MDDLISRQAAIDELANMYHAAEIWGQEAKDDEIKTRAESCMASIIEMKLRLEKLPATEPKTGRWEMKPDPYGFFDEIPVCSECGCTTKLREKYLYCPTCGAKMEGDAE